MHKTLALAVAILSVQAAWATDPVRPDRHTTPGATLDVTTAQVCRPRYSAGARHVSASEKKKVFEEYGIPWSRHAEFEVDHLISLELGGSNELANLWPQSYVSTPYNAHRKDALENRLHALVCHRRLSLKAAQTTIRTDWIAAYKKYVSRGR
jgi:hypothetical protein